MSMLESERVKLATLQKKIAPALAEVDEEFRRITDGDSPLTREICDHIRQGRSKRFRPTLLLLAAHATGLGACCMTGALAASAELAAIIGLDRRREIVCLVAVGRPAENPAAPSRKPTSEITEIIE